MQENEYNNISSNQLMNVAFTLSQITSKKTPKNGFSSPLLLAGPRLNRQRCEMNILINRFVLCRVSHRKVCIVQGVRQKINEQNSVEISAWRHALKYCGLV